MEEKSLKKKNCMGLKIMGKLTRKQSASNFFFWSSSEENDESVETQNGDDVLKYEGNASYSARSAGRKSLSMVKKKILLISDPEYFF